MGRWSPAPGQWLGQGRPTHLGQAEEKRSVVVSVRDQDGRPVEGALVVVQIYSTDVPPMTEYGASKTAVTDANGRASTQFVVAPYWNIKPTLAEARYGGVSSRVPVNAGGDTVITLDVPRTRATAAVVLLLGALGGGAAAFLGTVALAAVRKKPAVTFRTPDAVAPVVLMSRLTKNPPEPSGPADVNV